MQTKLIAIEPNWPAPKTIKAYTTLRTGGVSPAPYHELNLGKNTDDMAENIEKNRHILHQTLELPNTPIWLKQIHSTQVLHALPENINKEGDASFTHQPKQVCTVTTADCIPILVCNRQGTSVAAIHAGWRGLVEGVIEATLLALQLPPTELLVWLGPAIGPTAFEIGPEVREKFLLASPEAEYAFSPTLNQRWLGDLYALAKLRLQKQGVTEIYGGDYCTYSDEKRFFSYRRDGKETGRMASLIWIT